MAMNSWTLNVRDDPLETRPPRRRALCRPSLATAHDREEGGALRARNQHLDGWGIRQHGVTFAELDVARIGSHQTMMRLPSTTRTSVSAKRSIGRRC